MSRAPQAGPPCEDAGPLSGIRIIDLSAQISGPLGAGLLADQGAEVIKVEAPGRGDSIRAQMPQRNGVSAMFATINRNKKAVGIDLQGAEGRAVLTRLIATADVLIQNFRPGVIDRLGFAYEALAKINPRIIMVSVSGFGNAGPYADRRAYDPVVQAVAGYAAVQADPETGAAHFVHTAICDKLTALMVSQAVTSALVARDRHPSGAGQHVEIPMLDAALWFMWPDGMFNHTFVGDGWSAAGPVTGHMKIHKTRDGAIMMTMISQAEFRGACRALDCEDLAEDPRFSTLTDRYRRLDALNTLLAPRVAEFTTAALLDRLQAEDVPSAAINDREDVLNDPQVIARNIVEQWDHPTAGLMNQPSHPIKFGASRPARRPAPLPGEHTDALLQALGYSETELHELRATNVIA